MPVRSTCARREALDEGLALVLFEADWCGICTTLRAVLERVAAQDHGPMSIHHVDRERQPATARRFGVDQVPTLIVLVEGRVAAQIVGVFSSEEIVGLLDEVRS